MEELTFEQKLWKKTALVLNSLKPLGLYLFLPSILSCVGMLLSGNRDADDILNRSGNFYYTMGILVTLYLLHRSCKKRNSTLCEETVLEFKGLKWKRILLLFAMGMGAAVFFSALITVVPFPQGLMESYRSSSNGFREGNDRLLAWLSVIVLAPATEEIVFRGFLLGRLLEGFKVQTAIGISAVVFALCHVSALWMVYAGLMGLMLAWVVIKEDNLAYSIVLHMGFNASVIPVQIINTVCGYEAGVSAGKGPVALLGAAAAGIFVYTLSQYRKAELPI